MPSAVGGVVWVRKQFLDLDPSLPLSLLPVANRPLLTFPLRLMEEGGVTDVLLLCEGSAAKGAIAGWVARYAGPLQLQVEQVAEGCTLVQALRHVQQQLAAEHTVLVSGDVVTDVSLRALLLTHCLRGGVLTALLSRRKVSPTSETKPGKAPAGVDYVGLAAGDRIAFFASSAEAPKSLGLPLALLQQLGSLSLRTDLVDTQVYVVTTKQLLQALAEPTDASVCDGEVLPVLLRHQPLEDTQRMVGSVWAYCLPDNAYCKRATSLEAYAAANRDALQLAASLLREEVGGQGESLVGTGSTVGEKALLKKSVIGQRCQLGAHAKVVGSVLLDDVVVAEGATLRDCLLGHGCKVGEGAMLKDCCLGPGREVAAGAELRNQVLR